MTTPHPIPDAALESDVAILGKKGRVCGHCGVSFEARRVSDRALFCSTTCMGLAKRRLPRPAAKTCPVCSTSFVPTAKYPDKRFCSRKCWLCTQHTHDHQVMAGSRGGSKRAEAVRGKGDGYVKRGRRHEHRAVAEEKLGRPLLPGEIMHHRDETKGNNAPNNLDVLASQSEHAKLHFSGKKHSAEHIAMRMASRAATLAKKRGA